MFSISGNIEILIQLIGNLTPLLGAILSDESDELLIFSLNPVTLLDRRFLVLIELVLALRIVTAGNEMRNLDPVVFVQLLRGNALASAVFGDGPLKQLRLIISPVFLGIVGFLPLLLVEPIEYLGGEIIVDGVDAFAPVLVVYICSYKFDQ